MREFLDLDEFTYRMGRHEKRGRHERPPAGVLHAIPTLTEEQRAELIREWGRALKSAVTRFP